MTRLPSTRGLRSSLSRLLGRLPKSTRVTGIVAIAAIAIAAIALPVAGAAVDRQQRQAALDLRMAETAVSQRLAADGARELAEARAAALEFHDSFDGFSTELAGIVDAHAATVFEDARGALLEAVRYGGIRTLAAAADAVTATLAQLAASAVEPATALLAAGPLADQAAKDELRAAIDAIDGTDDAKTALARLLAASGAVTAAHAAAAAQAAEAEASERAAAAGNAPGQGASDWGEDTGVGEPSGPPKGGTCAESPLYCDPGVIASDLGPTIYCAEVPDGQPVFLEVSWTARQGNTVDVYFAYTDSDRMATDGFQLLVADQPESGSVQVPRTCPASYGEGWSYLTVRLVAKNAFGSTTTTWSGV